MTWGTSAKRTQRQSLASVPVPAPIGGINTVAPGLAMPPGDCVYAYNLISAEYGLRSRLGYREHVTGMTGVLNNSVRSVVPFVASDPTDNELFATTESGIWECTTTTAAPSLSIAFPDTSGNAGWGVSTVCATPAGRFCLYCDEVNGLFIWTQGGAWAAGVTGTSAAWAANAAVTVGVQVTHDSGKVYVCDTAGVTAASGGPSGTGTNIVDGTARWDYVGPVSANAIGPSLADQNNGLSLDLTDIVAVTVWKSRVWLVERNSSRAWYLDVNAVYGTATSFDFGSKMRAGGPLIGLYNWSYDGGSGIDTRLVGVSTAGDVVIYGGTDPDSATTFGLVGCWSVGGVPAGRRIVNEYGGDVLIMSTIGVIPLSKLVVGQPVVEGARGQYETAKIGNLFNQLVSVFGSLLGWALHIHPVDNALLLLVPQGNDIATVQLAMSWSTQGWTQYRDLPMLSAGIYGGSLYFGTADGRLCVNEGYVDNVQLSDPDDWTGVEWSVLSAYSNMGNAAMKQVKMVRVNMASDGAEPQAVPTVMYGFDLTEPAPPPFTPAALTGGSVWDAAIWDTSAWGGTFALIPYQQIYGGAGMGREVAIAIRGTAVARTVLVGFDVFFERGGLM